MNQNTVYLSIVVPAYNEEKRLPKTLLEINEYLRKQSYDYEILVVNDGSKDNTEKIAREMVSRILHLKIISYKNNQGKGYAVRLGILSAKGKYRLFTDADNSTPIEQIEKMLPEFKNGFDILIGSRNLKGAVLDPPQPLTRRVVGAVFRLFRKIIIGLWEIEDTQCGFKCFTAQAAADVLPRCRINRFAFDPEILLVAKKMGYKIKEIPVFWRNDLHSKVRFKSMIKMGIDIIKIKFNLIKGKYNL